MRASALNEYVIDLIDDHFDPDVAKAIKGDEDAFEALKSRLNRVGCGDAAEMTRIIEDISGQIDDGTADWLVAGADSPAAFVASRIN